MRASSRVPVRRGERGVSLIESQELNSINMLLWVNQMNLKPFMFYFFIFTNHELKPPVFFKTEQLLPGAKSHL